MTDAPTTLVTNKVDDLIFICERLSVLLDAENLALKNNQGGKIGEHLENKKVLCGAYESRGKAVLQDVSRLAEIDETLRTRLLELVRGVEEKIALNTQLLAVQIEVNRRFFDVLADAAREHAPKAGNYSQQGTVNAGPSPSPKGMPISIDQTL